MVFKCIRYVNERFLISQRIENEWKSGREEELQNLSEAIEAEKKEQWRAEGALLLMDAKKENIALQLEAAFRERAMNVYNEV